MNNVLLYIKLLITLLSIISSATSFAQTATNSSTEVKKREFRLEAIAGYGFGSTVYELNASAPDPRGSEDVVPIRSRLEFPLNVLLAGGKISWNEDGIARKGWGITLEALTNLNDPSSKMLNRDFIDGSEVIHTESNASLDFISANVEILYSLAESANTSFRLLLHTDYQRIEQYIVGYKGWQASLFSRQKFEISSTDPVLDYRVTYFSPQLGAEFTYYNNSMLLLGIKGSAGILFASDFDNHIVRERTSEGSGTGFGLNAVMSLELLPGALRIEQLSLAINGNIRYYYAEGGMDQTFSNGGQYMDIPYLFESFQGSFWLALGFSF